MFNLIKSDKRSKFGLVINWKFHKQNRWVCAQTPYLVDALIEAFAPIVISSQLEYEMCKRRTKYILSLEPGWAAPKIRYDKKQNHIVGVFVSDPHNKTDWFQYYIYKNDINYVFSYYYSPFFFHFPDFDKNRFVHVPWAIPDQFIVDDTSLSFHNQTQIHIFGGANSEAYDVRNWCREFPFVDDHQNSGVENKVMNDEEYFEWCKQFDAVIAAGSLSKKYQLVTPKYFEILAAGSLLFAQYCKDLDILGFTEQNCVIFDKNNFEEKCRRYIEKPEDYQKLRTNGVRLVRDRHKISNRIEQIKKLMLGEL